MSRSFSRRRFLERTAASVAGVVASPLIVQAQETGAQPPAPLPPSKKLNIAFVGTGGRAGAHVPLAETENCVAYCDIDPSRYGKLPQMAPGAKAYTDWREMFDKHKDIEAVIVTTPDHSHAAPSMRAIKSGIHVYCEKPLTWSIDEARQLAEESAKRKVVTQMGNQGHANEGNRLIVEWIRAGAIGDVLEVHTWTNRPVWPQGNLPVVPKPVPPGINWDAWIGPAPYRDFQENLHSFNWRGWFDFGCGAVGDMGCHTWDNVFWAMNPDYPTRVKLLEIVNKGSETFPSKSHFVWEFPEKNGRPAFLAHWYSGGLKPATPEEMLTDPVLQGKVDDKGNPVTPALPSSGNLYIGTKGKLLVSGDYGNSPRLIPEAKMQEFAKPENRPAKTLPRSPGHMNEFLMAAKGEKPWDFPGSNFSGYAGPITEVMLLGAIVEKIGEVGGTIECDPVRRTILTKEALPYRGREYRKGWEL